MTRLSRSKPGVMDMSDLQGISVFVLEDEPAIAVHVAEMLISLGCSVVGPAGTFAEADRLLLSKPPDLALVDFTIAGTPSFRIADLLRQLHVPFAFMTADPDAIQRPFNQFPVLTKPFDVEGLAEMLRQLWHEPSPS